MWWLKDQWFWASVWTEGNRGLVIWNYTFVLMDWLKKIWFLKKTLIWMFWEEEKQLDMFWGFKYLKAHLRTELKKLQRVFSFLWFYEMIIKGKGQPDQIKSSNNWHRKQRINSRDIKACVWTEWNGVVTDMCWLIGWRKSHDQEKRKKVFI